MPAMKLRKEDDAPVQAGFVNDYLREVDRVVDRLNKANWVQLTLI